MGRRWWMVLVLLAAVAATAIALAVVPRQSPHAGEVVAAYDAPRQPGDPRFPSGIDLGIEPGTVRYLGEADGGTFWVGRDADEQLCFAVVVTKAELAGGTCGAVEILRENGLLIGLEGSRESLVAYLVPDDVAADAAPAPWTVVGENVLVADPADLDGEMVLTLPRADGGVILLHR